MRPCWARAPARSSSRRSRSAANQLFLVVLVAAGADHLAAQAVAIILATPFSFAANKLWAFAEPASVGELQPAAVRPGRRDR